MTEFVYSERAGKLSEILTERLNLSYGALQKLFRKGDVRVNGKKIYADCRIESGAVVRVYYKERERSFVPFFENEKIACFFKPAKLACVGENSLETAVKRDFGYTACHRLDTNTEGIVVFAKSVEVFEEIKKAFKARSVEKHYLTVVAGQMVGAGELRAYLTKNADRATVKVTGARTDNSAEIITGYEALYNGKSGTVLDVELVTGRTHQIRAHLAFCGHSVIGDPKYGSEKLNRQYGKKRQMLRAYKVIFHTKEGPLKDMDGLTVVYDSSEYFDELKALADK